MIPKGAVDGQTIRLRGLGHPGGPRSEPGDVLLTIRVQPHPRFKVEGADLRVSVDVPLEDAILGGTIRVRPHGRRRDEMPPMTSSGKDLPPARQGTAEEGRHPWRPPRDDGSDAPGG